MKICCKRLLVLFVFYVLWTIPSVAQNLESGFVTPPDDTKPWVYW